MTVTAAELLILDGIAIRDGGRLAFRGTRWTWRHGEQWAILGPNGSGKSLLALALRGHAPVVRGEIEAQSRQTVPQQATRQHHQAGRYESPELDAD